MGKQSKADQSRQVTANLASASIPNTRASARRHAGIKITRVTGTVTTPTTTVAVPTTAAIAAVSTLRKHTARSVNAKIQVTNPAAAAVRVPVSTPSTRAMATATMPTTTVAVRTMVATAVLNQSRAGLSRKVTAKPASASIPKTGGKPPRTAKVPVVTPSTRAMATATMPTTTVAVRTTVATAVLNQLR